MIAATLTIAFGFAVLFVFFTSRRETQQRRVSEQSRGDMKAEPQRLGLKAGVYGLSPGVTYRVIRPIKDCYGEVFPVGMQLLFVGRHYLPYHGGHTVVFEPRPMYLQDEINSDVLNQLDAYLEALPADGLTPPDRTNPLT